MKKFLLSTTIFFIFIATATAIYASTTDGTIDPSTLGNYKAVLQNDPGIGSSNLTINFGLFTDPAVAPYNIHITSNGITGYAWSPIMGWISMNCANPTSTCTSNNDNFKVSVSSTGVLSGYAWAQNTGWVNFGPFANAGTSQVKIGTDGKFGGTLGSAGYAWGQNVGLSACVVDAAGEAARVVGLAFQQVLYLFGKGRIVPRRVRFAQVLEPLNLEFVVPESCVPVGVDLSDDITGCGDGLL